MSDNEPTDETLLILLVDRSVVYHICIILKLKIGTENTIKVAEVESSNFCRELSSIIPILRLPCMTPLNPFCVPKIEPRTNREGVRYE